MACSENELGSIVKTADLVSAAKKIYKFIEEAFNRDIECKDISEIYQSCDDLMMYDNCDWTIQKLTDKIKSYLSSVVLIKIKRSFGDGFLIILKNQWDEFKDCMSSINTVFLHYNNILIKSNKDKVIDLGLKMFRDLIVCNSEVQEKFRMTLLKLIKDSRVAYRIEYSSLEPISTACEMLNELSYETEINVYESVFEQAFLDQSSCYYKKLSGNKITASSATEYISFVEHQITAELARNELFTTKGSVGKNQKILEKELIEKHLKEIVSNKYGAEYLLSEDMTDQLARMYSTLSRVEKGVQLLIECVKTYINREGIIIMKEDNKKKAHLGIQSLIKLKDRLDGFLCNSFKSDINFNRTINVQYEKVIKMYPIKAPCLSLFIDIELQKVFFKLESGRNRTRIFFSN